MELSALQATLILLVGIGGLIGLSLFSIKFEDYDQTSVKPYLCIGGVAIAILVLELLIFFLL